MSTEKTHTFPKRSHFATPALRSLFTRYKLLNEEEIDELEGTHKDCMLIESLMREGVSRAYLSANIIGALRLQTVDLLHTSIDHKLVTKYDLEDAIYRRYLPFAQNDKKVRVAFADPLDVETIRRLQYDFGSEIEVVLGIESDIISVLGKLVSLRKISEASSSCTSQSSIELARDSIVSDSSGADSDTMVKLVNDIMVEAISAGVSDIHFEPGLDAMNIKFRQDGVMDNHLSIPKNLQPFITARLKLLARMDITERRRPQDGRFRFVFNGVRAVDVRVSSVPTPAGEKIVMRILGSQDESRWNFGVLGMSATMEQSLMRLLEIRDRLVVVTGPTGSGKSTTLYSSLYVLLKEGRQIVTIEDPVEYRIDGITQIQVDSKNGVDFATCLRSVLRQDPEVIMIGEIRDGETANTALKAAQTGHQVLSSLHTSTAPSAVVRLIDMGCQPFVVATSLGGVVAQRLVRKLCKNCAKPMDDRAADELRRKHKLEIPVLMQPVGCPACHNSGYNGREAIFSFFVVTPEIADIIRTCRTEHELIKVAVQVGYRSIAFDGLCKVAQGRTSLQELLSIMGAVSVEEAVQEAPLDSNILELE